MHTHPQEEPLWSYPQEDMAWRNQIIKEFKIHPVVAGVLVARGFTTIKEVHDFLYSKLPDLHDPFLFNEMEPAVNRICKALKQQEKIFIYGDNDVDGMTGTALLVEFLRHVGGDVIYSVASPNSATKAIIVEALDDAVEQGCKVLITVDCGVSANKEIAACTARGIDVIVTDHHEPPAKLPQCTAILNPKLPNNTYPERNLTGVGVAFKLAHAIANELHGSKRVDLKRFLDLVALGTISDMGALRGENRILVRYGINQIQKGKRIGLAKLISIVGVDVNVLNTYTIASRVTPPLNSLGRIANANDGVELLLIRNSNAAEKMALELGLNNLQRQKIERFTTEDVEETLKKNPELLREKAIVIASDNWHPGIIPIVSTRLSKKYNRPTVVISEDEHFGKGSMRSIAEFPLLEALKECADYLENFGGHDFAAGFVIKRENIPDFTEKFIAISNKTLKNHDVKSRLQLDAHIDFEELTFECLESIRLLEPFGNENPPPILYTEAMQAWPPKVIGKPQDRAHLKLFLEQGERLVEGVALNRASDSAMLRKKDLKLLVAFTPQMDNFKSQSCIRLLIRDFKAL